VHRVKPGNKRATKTIFTVKGFYDSPKLGACVEIDNGYGRHFEPIDKIKDAKEVELTYGKARSKKTRTDTTDA
jgi:hypothetical protein